MKKHIKPIIFLVALILLTSIVGCGPKGNSDNTVDAKSNEEEDKNEDTENSNTNEEDLKDKYEAFDLGGRTIKISSWWPVVQDSSMKKPDPAIYPSENLAKYENIKKIEEKYNCKIQFIEVSWEQMEFQLEESVLEGLPYADIVYLPMNFSIPAIAKGYLLPISEFASPNSDILTDNIAVTSLGKLIDDEYGVKIIEVPDNGVFMGYNKSIIDELGLETPIEIYKNNSRNWNWEKFLEYAKAATSDVDGDGNIDRFGYGGFINRTIANFVIANDGELFSDFDSGKHGLDNPKTIRALEFINELYNKHKVVYTARGDLWNYEDNYSSFKNGDILFFPVLSWMLEEIKGLPFEYGIVPFPTGPDNISGKTCAISQDAFYIPKGVEEPKKVYQVLEELLWFFGDNTGLRDDNKKEWLKNLWVTEEAYQMSIEVSTYHGKFEFYEFVPGFPMGEIMGNIISGGMKVEEAVELYKEQAQDAVDQLYINKD
jgi:multiple sugar transport system substrate-binding protein